MKDVYSLWKIKYKTKYSNTDNKGQTKCNSR